MTTTTTAPSVPLPLGAVSTEEWQPNTSSHYRNFQGEIREVLAGARYGAHAVAVYAHAVQHDDGRIDDGLADPVFVPPCISMLTIDDEDGRPTYIGVTLTSAAARRLADVHVSAADEVDGWATR
jgi:hypothetical protein